MQVGGWNSEATPGEAPGMCAESSQRNWEGGGRSCWPEGTNLVLV